MNPLASAPGRLRPGSWRFSNGRQRSSGGLRHSDFRGELPREQALENAGIDLADQIDRLGRRDSLGVREAVFDL